MTVETVTVNGTSVEEYDSSCIWCTNGWADLDQRQSLFQYRTAWCECENPVEEVHGDENEVWVSCSLCQKLIQVQSRILWNLL